MNQSRLPDSTEEHPIVSREFARLRAAGREPLNLHKTAAHAPQLLAPLLDLIHAARHECQTSRRLRELVIVRTAQIEESDYELAHHLRMAREAGIDDSELAALAEWRDSGRFDERERAALAFAEHIAAGSRRDDAALDRLFTPREIVELTMTASCYVMIARAIRAWDVRLEDAAA
ncbi:MAG: carboxymuconolactone decarboxylase family protein [Stackebrandtia sp.]